MSWYAKQQDKKEIEKIRKAGGFKKYIKNQMSAFKRRINE